MPAVRHDPPKASGRVRLRTARSIAWERQADLVVTGTLGSGFLRNRLVGSTAIGESSSDVLVCTRSDA